MSKKPQSPPGSKKPQSPPSKNISPGGKKKSKLTAEKKKELANRFKASEEDVAKFADVFDELDQDSSGTLDGEKLIKAITKVGIQIAPKQSQKIIQLYCGAKRLGVDIDKFIIIILRKLKWSKQPDATEQEANNTFKSFDKNGDGFLSAKELREGMERLGDPMTDEEAEELMKMADKNGDGKVSYKEFMEMWKEYYG